MNLIGANLTIASLIGADLSGTLSCAGICICSTGSVGTCNGCAPVDICTF
ncbi:MAG: hypothetical protein GTO02_21020 [Candidatus Dadabacteria bacterium]|nr:hypothetical protein [Candidatus Dadabacteria bacterium]NIQ16772.1 hypothetical protein [Candidatus Dadabacteria bacterium]